MSRKLVIPLVALLVLLGLILTFTRAPEPPKRETPNTADWDAFGYQLAKSTDSRQFNVQLKLKADAAPFRARLLLNHQDEANYYFVQFTDADIEIGRVENGLETRIGTRAKAGLPKGTSDIAVKRRTSEITVVVDGALTATAYDDTFSRGSVGFGALDQSATLAAPLKCQRVGEVCFADDFMRAETETGGWEPLVGTWSINTLDNPSLSSNAFFYVGKAASRGTVVKGEWFWDDYAFEVSCQPKTDKPIGLFFYYRDESNHFLFKWDAKMRLIKALKGQQTVLAEKDIAFTPHQWYSLKAQVSGNVGQIYVDDRLIFEFTDSHLCFGKIGLYTEDTVGTNFDDVQVTSTRRFADDFSEYAANKWTPLGGKWMVIGEDAGGKSERAFAATAKEPAKAVAGEADWHDYTLSADLGRWGKGTAGLCFYYLDEGNYYSFQWDGSTGEQRLLRVVDSQPTLLATAKGAPPAAKHRVAATIDAGHITIRVDGQPALEEWDRSLKSGKVGLYAENALSAFFDNVAVEFLKPKEPLLTVHEVFAHEVSMQSWSGEQGDWEDVKQLIKGKDVVTHWHRADFRGDMDIELKLDKPPAQGAEVMLAVSVDKADPNSGYRLFVAKASPLTLELFRAGQLVNRKALPEAETADPLKTPSFKLSRAGSFVVAFVDNEPALEFRDTAPLRGSKAGWFANGVEMKRENIKIYNDSVFNYTFQQATTDWRATAGVWDVTNRWQCDPRWSFFSGVADSEKDRRDLAAIWNKREFQGDVTLEFYAGIKMDRDRGMRYEYASDINATICGDGRDLTSGYSFLFGGWKDTKSAIVRGDKIVAETSKVVIPRESNIHRRWFYIRAEKAGNLLRYYVDNELILQYKDENPLPGTRIALWTWKVGVMVARVRISSEGGQVKEIPGSVTPSMTCATVYGEVPGRK